MLRSVILSAILSVISETNNILIMVEAWHGAKGGHNMVMVKAKPGDMVEQSLRPR